MARWLKVNCSTNWAARPIFRLSKVPENFPKVDLRDQRTSNPDAQIGYASFSVQPLFLCRAWVCVWFSCGLLCPCDYVVFGHLLSLWKRHKHHWDDGRNFDYCYPMSTGRENWKHAQGRRKPSGIRLTKKEWGNELVWGVRSHQCNTYRTSACRLNVLTSNLWCAEKYRRKRWVKDAVKAVTLADCLAAWVKTKELKITETLNISLI